MDTVSDYFALMLCFSNFM